MKKQITIKIFSFIGALFIVLLGFLIKAENKADRYQLEIENHYSRSLNLLESGVNNITILLKKVEFSTSPKEISQTAAQLLTEAEISKNALSQLPKSSSELTVINRFLSQVGYYAMAASKSLVTDNSTLKDFESTIPILINTAEQITKAVTDSNITYNNSKYWASELGNNLKDIEGSSLEDAFSTLEESLSDYPTLIYDGPYSDHILEKEPTLIKNAKEVDQKTAVKTASIFSGIGESDLKFTNEVNGKIAAFRFKSQNLSITVSKKGGYAVGMRRERPIDENVLSYESAIERAQKFLEKVGFENFKETYYFTDEGVCVINFAFVDGQTICYTDLIKVGVAMDNGEIMLYEANGYLSNHIERAFQTPTVSESDAKKKVSRKLTVKSSTLALIPTNSGGEVRCYEFTCETADNQEVLVYINAVTCEEEEILILLKSDGGTLVK